MGLPGVKVGPLDPERTAEFGQVSAKNSARQLIRLHHQMYPPALKQQLVRKLDEPRTMALQADEVAGYVATLTHENGDPVLPDGARWAGATVRGEKQDPRGQVLTFTYVLRSGRTGKWFAPYSAAELPESYAAGEEAARVHQMRERGLVSFDSEGTRSEILERQLAQSRREAQALRQHVESGGLGDVPADAGALSGARSQAIAADELEQKGRELVELREQMALMQAQLAQYQAVAGAQGGGLPAGGVGEGSPPAGAGAVAEDPPLEGYDNMVASDVARWLKDDARSADERQVVLDYELAHANRKTVVSTARDLIGLEPTGS